MWIGKLIDSAFKITNLVNLKKELDKYFIVILLLAFYFLLFKYILDWNSDDKR